jgi:F-type H+-transporting ATPase subunit b
MRELIQEMLREITGQPFIFTVEVVQFLALVVVLRALLLRLVRRDLEERRERIAAKLEKADRADAAYTEAQQQAAVLLADARAEARRIIEAAGTAAREERGAGRKQVEEEADEILFQARQAVEKEKDKVAGEASEHLVTLITEVTRSFINESLTESERRAVTEKLILASLQEIEGTASPQ